mgnify:CR=1 FL=1|tara:strand:+ start:1126 stop:1395 length:270 start_codon:yes stop_codon:yes gene_type:complete
MFGCYLCEKEYCYVSKFCDKCRRIKHLINLYGDDVYKTLEEVLVRTEKQQDNKIKTSIKPVIERKLPEDTRITIPREAKKPNGYKNVNK